MAKLSREKEIKTDFIISGIKIPSDESGRDNSVATVYLNETMRNLTRKCLIYEAMRDFIGNEAAVKQSSSLCVLLTRRANNSRRKD